MTFEWTERFRDDYQALPKANQAKIVRCLLKHDADPRHPSLQSKKIKGTDDIWEARVDLQYRLTFTRDAARLILRVVGNHDDVLRNPYRKIHTHLRQRAVGVLNPAWLRAVRLQHLLDR